MAGQDRLGAVLDAKRQLHLTRVVLRARPGIVAGACALLLANVAGVARAQAPATAPAPPPVAGTPVRAQDGTAIATVRFGGLVNLDENFALTLIRTRAGDAYSAATVTQDIERLFRGGKFDDVTATTTMEADRLVVTFTVVERAQVRAIEFVGNQKFKTKDLLTESGLSEGSPISEYTIKKAKDAIERKYKDAGYYYIKVDLDVEALRRDNRVVLTISEGPRVRVRKVQFEGNAAYSAFALNGKIETKTYIWIFRKGDFDDERARSDAATLAAFYHDEGYLDAQVGYETQFADNRSDVTVRFIIKEGVRYHVRSVTVKGATRFPAEELIVAMKLKAGSPLIAEMLRSDVKAVRDKYGQGGYVYAEARADWVYAAETGLVDLTVTIVQEGKQYRIGRVIIRGNRRTQDRVARRELDFRPEDIFDTTKTDAAQNRLKETRLFSEATVSPFGDDPNTRDALVEVKEGNTTGVLFGLGVTSNSGLVGTVTLENRNFDLFDWPRDTSEFLKGRAFRGAGQTIRVQAEPGTQLNRYRLDFREPYLFDQPYGFNQSFYLFQRQYDDYKDQRLGLSPSFDHRFKTGPLRDWAVEAALRIEQVKISDVDFDADEDVQDVAGYSTLTSIKGTVVHNTTDSLFLPTKGSRLTLSWEQFGALGGDYTFARVIGDYNQFFTVRTDALDRKHIIGVGGTIGRIFGNGPVFERLYAGGIGSIRGFAFRGVSPRGGRFFNTDEAIGGNFELLTNAEYSFPLVGKVLRGVTFLDMGTVDNGITIGTWRAAIGVGARVYIPFFGPIPLTFDFAAPISKNGDDDTQVFSFSFGSTF